MKVAVLHAQHGLRAQLRVDAAAAGRARPPGARRRRHASACRTRRSSSSDSASEHPEIRHSAAAGSVVQRAGRSWARSCAARSTTCAIGSPSSPTRQAAGPRRAQRARLADARAATTAGRRRAAGRRLLELAPLRSGDRARAPRPRPSTPSSRPSGRTWSLVTPLVEPARRRPTYLRSARALGIRTGLCVYSWDNLTNKGLIHDPLDLVTVWNEAMKREAVDAAPRARRPGRGDRRRRLRPLVHVAAATRRATRSAPGSGCRPGRPYLLYLCSSKFIAPRGSGVRPPVGRRSSRAAPALRDVGVLVRPHPQNAGAMDGRGPVRSRRCGDVAARRRRPGRRRVAGRLFRLHSPQRGGGWREHERADRERDRRPRRLHACCDPSSATRRKARCTSTTSARTSRVCCRWPRPWPSMPRSWRKAVAGGGKTSRATASIRRVVRPALRPLGTGGATPRSGARGHGRDGAAAPRSRTLVGAARAASARQAGASSRAVQERRRGAGEGAHPRARAVVPAPTSARKNERIAAKKQASAARALEKEQNAARRAAARQAEAETAVARVRALPERAGQGGRHAPG